MREAAGPLAALGATVAGILVGARFPPGPAGGVLGAAVLTGASAWLVRRGRLPVGLLALGVLSTALTLRANDGIGRAAHEATLTGGPVVAKVELVGDPVPAPYRTRAVVRMDGRHVLAVADRPVSARLAVLEAGDRLVVRARVVPLTPEEARRWRHRHVGARLAVDDVLDLRAPASPILALANRTRRLVLAGADTMAAPERGLVSGFLVGDTRSIPDTVVGDFRASGLSHLLAVSGANVAFVLALVGPGVRRFGLRGRLCAAVVILAVFAAVTRFEPSVLRASTMAGLAALASFLGRPASGVRLLALAATGLLLVDPLLLDSLGFRLSCAASAGILLGAGPIARRLRGPAVVREALAVTTAAQLAVAPVLLPVFGSMPVGALPANLLAAPLVGPLTAWGMVSGVASGLVEGWIPEAAGILQIPTLLLVRSVAMVAHLCARIPWTLGPTASWGVLATGFSVAAWRHRSHRLDGDGNELAPRAARV